MADSYTQVAVDGAGDKIDTEQVIVGANIVQRQRIEIAGVAAGEIARVQATTPAGTEQGLVVRSIPSGTQVVSGDVTVEGAVEIIGLVGVVDGGFSLSVDDGGSSLTVDGSVALVPATSGGCSVYRVIALASTNAANIKPTPGQVYGWYLFNNSSVMRYVKLYNKASAPTVGTDTPRMTLPIPPGGGAVAVPGAVGIDFTTGIAIAITNGIADSDNTGINADEVVVNLFWK